MSSRRYLILKTATALLALNGALFSASAQDGTVKLSLEEAISATLSNNKAIQIAKLDEDIALSNFKQTSAIFLPQVNISYTAMTTNNPLHAFGFKLQQKNITANDFNPSLLNNPDVTGDFTTKVELQQPLVNLDLFCKRKAAAKQTALYQYQTQRTREFLTFEVNRAFLQLQQSYQAVTVLEEALQTSQYVYTFTNNHYLQGLIQKSDLLNAEVQVTTMATRLAKAKSNIRNASDYLSLLMGKADGLIYKIDTVAAYKPTVMPPVREIKASRADFEAIQMAIEASGFLIQSSKMTFLPRLNAFGSYQLNDYRMVGFGANAYWAGLQLSWDVFKGNSTRNTIATQVLERTRMVEQLNQQRQQGQLELDKANRDLEDALFEVKQQELAVAQASEALKILQNRYRQGLVATSDVLQATTQLAMQKFALSQAVYTTQVTAAYIELLTTPAKK